MRACFINPPVRDFYSTSIRRQPLGLLYIMAAVRSAGHDAVLVNGHSPKKRVLPLPSEFSYLSDYIGHGDPRYRFPFRNYSHYGLSFQEVRQRVSATEADVIFIPSLFTPYHRETETVIALAKEAAPGAPVVTGGYHAALYPEYHLREAGADFVVTGEGEGAAVALMDRLAAGGDTSRVPGLVRIENGAVVRNEGSAVGNIDSLPFPARDALADRDFRVYRRRAASMVTSRGCPNRCGFCTVHAVWGGAYRERSVDSVMAEVRECAERFNVGMINFEDDNLFASRERAARLLGELISYQESSGTRLDCAAMNGVSLEQMDEEILALMSRAGFGELNISLMSHSAELQKKQGRPFDSDRFARIARAARKLGMNVRAYFILGLPGQTKDEVRDTIAFLGGLDVKFFPSVYYNVRGPREEWMMQRSSAFFNETEELSRDDLIMLFNECYRQPPPMN
ncbi:MAG TPA: radical SAM protein [Spirochaetota bacterium]|nr:radical SAM protein [Spirochaetota bacterium]HPL16792.1 radical SAM protein [Spirochaetota bacterium]HQF07139.1 radical SAM protein [Spirochaetota bacterium]HQH95876.1 radical SAM protein [Spirochaetota bacterium]HQJ72066.1 radical SAM protein [Spirochaetota bacterium]